MGIRCSIRCGRCNKNILIKEGGLNKKTNRIIECQRCGHKNSVFQKKNGKVAVA